MFKIDELELVYHTVGQGSELGNVGDFTEGSYMSSTDSSAEALGTNFFSQGEYLAGESGTQFKHGYYYVCPIRSF